MKSKIDKISPISTSVLSVSVIIISFLLWGQCLGQVEHNISNADSINSNDNNPLRKIDSIVFQAIKSGAFPGCQVYAIKRGEVLVNKSYGYHTYDSLHQVKNTDLYDLASITKIAAATISLMKMHDDGLLDLDKTLGYYFPTLKRSNKKDIILRKALSHFGRIKSWIPYHKEFRKANGKFRKRTISEDSTEYFSSRIGENYFIHDDIEQRIFKLIKSSKLNNDEGYVYSGLLFYLIPNLIERTYGMPFKGFLNRTFYDSIGAETLCFNPLEKFSIDRIVPTEIDSFFRMEKINGYVHDEGAILMNGVSGNAGLFGNATDLSSIMEMLSNYGYYNGKQYLSPETVIKFTSCQYCESDNRRGLGFDKPLINYDSIKSSVAYASSKFSFGHTGYTGTLVWADPANGLVYVFLSNRVYPRRENKKIYQLNIRPAIHEILYSMD